MAWWGLRGKNWGSRLRGLISCLVFVPRLDHPYIVPQECVGMEILPYWGKGRHVLTNLTAGGSVAEDIRVIGNGGCCQGELKAMQIMAAQVTQPIDGMSDSPERG